MPVRSLAAVVLVVVLPPCGSPGGPGAVTRRPGAPEPDRCLGRFRFATPAGLRVSNSEFALYGTDVRGQPLGGQPPEAVWAAHLAALGANPEYADVEPFELPSGLRGATYRHGPNTLLVDAFAAQGDEGLWLHRSLPEGKLPVAQRLLDNIASVWAVDPSRGFCFGAGALHAVSLSERARVHLVDDARPEFRLEVDTLTVERPAASDLEFGEARDFARLTKSKLEVLRDRTRGVAGLVGTERWLSMTVPDGRELLRFDWRYGGAPREAAAPRLTVHGVARGVDREALEAAFEAILASVEPIPLHLPRDGGAEGGAP